MAKKQSGKEQAEKKKGKPAKGESVTHDVVRVSVTVELTRDPEVIDDDAVSSDDLVDEVSDAIDKLEIEGWTPAALDAELVRDENAGE